MEKKCVVFQFRFVTLANSLRANNKKSESKANTKPNCRGQQKQQQQQQQQLNTYEQFLKLSAQEYTQLNSAAESAALNLSSIGVTKSGDDEVTEEATHELRMLRQVNVAAAMAVVVNVTANANASANEPVPDTDCEQ